MDPVAASLLPPAPLLGAFLAASFLLAVTPGPGVFYIVARSLLQGRAHGLASVAGVAAGNLANAIAAGLGLAALFAVSALAFTGVKWAGAAYLVWLGLRALFGGEAAQASDVAVRSLGRIFRDGFLVALLNPKTTLFFAAFLPQFMSPDGPHATQAMMLGTLFVVIAALTDTVYALAAGRAARLLAGSGALRRGSRILSGGAFIGLGIFTALAGPRTVR